MAFARALYLNEGIDSLVVCRCDNGNRKIADEFRLLVMELLRQVPLDFGWMRPTWTRALLCLEAERRGLVRVAPCTMGLLLASMVTPGKNQKFYLAGTLDIRTEALESVEDFQKNSKLFGKLLFLLATRYRKARTIHELLKNARLSLPKYRWSRVSDITQIPLRAAA